MIDLHFHCLPGIDDGPPGWDAAEELCRLAASDGTTTIVATPHVLREPWLNERPEVREGLLAELNRRLGGKPKVVQGCEAWYTGELVSLVERGGAGPFRTLGGSRYLLVEFAPGYVPSTAEADFHELVVMGVVPVIAHPERNLPLVREPGLLGLLVEAGALVQLTAGSLTGEFGRAVQRASEAMLEDGIVHFVASDAHDCRRRPPRMAAARERVRRLMGPEVEAGVFDANPEAVLRNAELAWLPGA